MNALCDRSWIVRTAAALAVGECRDPLPGRRAARSSQTPSGRSGIAAAAALAAWALPAPPSRRAWPGQRARAAPDRRRPSGRPGVERLVAAHPGRARRWPGGPRSTPAESSAAPGLACPVGPRPAPSRATSREAEMRRYAAGEGDTTTSRSRSRPAIATRTSACCSPSWWWPSTSGAAGRAVLDLGGGGRLGERAAGQVRLSPGHRSTWPRR